MAGITDFCYSRNTFELQSFMWATMCWKSNWKLLTQTVIVDDYVYSNDILRPGHFFQ